MVLPRPCFCFSNDVSLRNQDTKKKHKYGVGSQCCKANTAFIKVHLGTFSVSTSSLSKEESMKTSLK